MHRRRSPVSLAAAMLFALVASAVHAGPSPADKCEAAKLKAAGKACSCRHSAAAAALVGGTAPDFTKCTTRLTDAFASAETKAGGACPNVGEGTTVEGRLAGMLSGVETVLDTASAATPAAAKCAAAKLKAAGKKCACMHKAQASAAAKHSTPDFTKCDEKIAAAFAKAEATAAT